MMRKIVYLAGPLFNAGERIHLLCLEDALRKLGYRIILPQREALKFNNVKDITRNCARVCANEDIVFVGCLDGADADSGMAVEYGIAYATGKQTICYRTDFRTDPEKEIGVNGMLLLEETKFIYHPCFVTDSRKIKLFYKELAKKIDEAIRSF